MRFLILLVVFYYSPSHAINEYKSVLSRYKLNKKDISYVVIDTENSKIVKSHNPDKAQVLASVSKIFSIYYALSNLGEDFQFKTKLYYSGKIENNELKGNLFLQGFGQPLLKANHLLSMISKLKSIGVKKVIGDFYVIDNFFIPQDRISDIGLEDQSDNPAISGLNVEFNRFKVFKGEHTIPKLNYIDIKTKNKSFNGQKFSFSGNLNKESWIYNKKENAKKWEELPVKNSAMYTGHFFKYLASLNQISIPDPKKEVDVKNATLIHTVLGNNLSELSSQCLEYSNNLIAESILMMASGKKSPLDASTVMHEWLKKNHPQINWNQSRFENGSGLTLNNIVTPQTLSSFLNKIQNKMFKHISFESLLSINGHSGGVRKRLKTPDLAYRVYAKTGSLFYINNIGGYLIGKSNKKYAFAIFVNDMEKRVLLEKNNSKAKALRKKSSIWYRNAIFVQDSLLKDWINHL